MVTTKTHDMMKIFFITRSNVFYLASLLLFFFLATGCNNRKTAEKTALDSAYIVSYMNAEPQFKDQIGWAKSFYKARSYQLGWFKNNELVPQASKLIQIIDKSAEEGLDPKDYQVVDLRGLINQFKGSAKNEDLRDSLEKKIDLALSATYFNWAADYYRGLLGPRESKKADWDIKLNKMKLDLSLKSILDENKDDDYYFKPNHVEYANLKKALANYREVQSTGGWPIIPVGSTVQEGKSSAVVPLLNKRLAGYLVKDSTMLSSDSTTFSKNLKSALKQFQSFNGIAVTGRLDKKTIQILNIPVEDRIKQIIINMERWRWIPQSFEPDYLIVNIPEFRLHVYEKGQDKMTMKVIVGKALHSTPIFNDKMEDVVLAPYWNIPPGILKREVAPQAARDPGYLASKDMEVVIRGSNTVVDPKNVNWAAAGTSSFKYLVRRKPGPQNDLGNVKFIFPNSMNIYLHDTPGDQLFNQSKRDFSHGCVRVERPIDLAVYLLRDVKGWDKTRIEEQIKKGKERYVALNEKLPVYLVYFTASADANGRVRFFEDIYNHDKTLKSLYFSKL